ncbi:retrovirus-related pol polyprotein from transposon TNT 1-94 [Tanacetum coccineum]
MEKFLGTVKLGMNKIAPILGYGDLVQGTITIKRVYYVEGLNHNLFSVGQFCDADLEVAFRKSTCYIHDLKGNDLLTGSRGTDLYSITLQDSTTPNPICLMAKATSSQAWLWHRRLSHLNFDTINLLLKNNIVNGLPKLKFVKDHLCSSYFGSSRLSRCHLRAHLVAYNFTRVVIISQLSSKKQDLHINVFSRKLSMVSLSRAAHKFLCPAFPYQALDSISLHKEQVEKGNVEFILVGNEYQLADLFTKAFRKIVKYLVRHSVYVIQSYIKKQNGGIYKDTHSFGNSKVPRSRAHVDPRKSKSNDSIQGDDQDNDLKNFKVKRKAQNQDRKANGYEQSHYKQGQDHNKATSINIKRISFNVHRCTEEFLKKETSTLGRLLT